MILVLGGHASGKRTFVESLGFVPAQMSYELDEAVSVLLDAQELLRVNQDIDYVALAEKLNRYDVVTCSEIGTGIVSIDPAERAFCETAGRFAVALADSATCVVRMICGIPQVIKGDLPYTPTGKFADIKSSQAFYSPNVCDHDSSANARSGLRPVFLSIYRHGPTRLNRARKYLGAIDEPLDWEGEQLVRAEGSNQFVNCVYVSPLSRCRQTAKIMFPNAEQIVVDELMEMNFGDFDGFSYEELSNDSRYQAWVDDGCKTICPNGEGQSGFVDRVCDGIRKVLNDAHNKRLQEIIIVAHAGTAMASFWSYCSSERDYFDWHIQACKGLRAQLSIEEDGTISLGIPETVMPCESYSGSWAE